MDTLTIIKPLMALFVLLLTSKSIAAVYTNYLPTVDTRGLSIIISVVMILGLMAFKNKHL